MAVTLTATYTLPKKASQDNSVGTTSWAYVDEIKTNDNQVPNAGWATNFSTFDTIQLVEARLIIDGVIGAIDKSALEEPDAYPDTPVVFGGTSDLWGATLTADQLTSPEFGFALAYGDVNAVGTPISYYLCATDFQFAIPSSATIGGIQAKIEHCWYPVGGGGLVRVAVDDIQMQITFSWAPEAKTNGYGGGYVYVEDTGQPKPQKTLRYFVYDSDDNYLREWRDVATEISLRTEVNKSLYNIDLELARNPFDQQVEIVPWELEQGGYLTDEANDLQLSFDAAAAIGLGPGTDVNENNTVEIKAFYGQYDILQCEDGSPLLTEDNHAIFIENGRPDGHSIYRGFIQDWEVDLGNNDSVTVYLMNDAEELNNIMLETDETVAINQSVLVSERGIAGAGWDDNIELCQSFTMVGTLKSSRISLFAKTGFAGYSSGFTASLYEGSDPNAPGTLLASGFVNVSNYITHEELSLVFPNSITLTNGQPYLIKLTTNDEKTGGGGIYPIYFATGSSYAGGVGYIKTNSVPTFIDMGVDLAFKVYEAGLDTTVTYNSMDPSNIAKRIIDFARSQGAQINYTNDSIDLTGTEVSITFQTNTIAEALEQVVKLCPAEWYWTYDPGTNIYSLKTLSSEPTRKFTNKGDIVSLKLRKSLTQLINQVYFSGGGDPALFRKVTDIASRNQYRKALKKLSDSRVTDDDTAVIISQSEIDRYKDPIYIATATISGQHPDPIEDIELGEKIGFLNFGNFIDDIELQISAMSYNLDTLSLDLGVILPKVTKRIEDIKRNLDIEQQKNNPAVPDE
jgi:hypothetical protein